MIVSHVPCEDLHLATQTPKCGAVKYPVAVSLKWAPIRML
jgi:hypothetical protein